MTDYSELKRLAERIREGSGLQGMNAEEAMFNFECAATPDVILAMLAENERLDRESHNTRIILVDMVESRDQLKAENEALKCAQQHYDCAIEGLMHEAKALRKDAERYRHIRQHSYVEVRCDSPRKNGWRPDLLDICVDAAMSQGEQI